MLKQWLKPAALQVVLGSVLGIVFEGCSHTAAQPFQVEAYEGQLGVDLELSPTFDPTAVHYLITGNGITPLQGDVPVIPGSRTVSFLLGGIPAGNGYKIQLSAVSADNKIHCAGSAEFNIRAGETTSLTVQLNCRGEKVNGGIRVDGTANYCPNIRVIVVRAGADQSFELQATADDEEHDPLTYLWAAASGTWSDASAARTSYTCGVAGDQELTLQVSDGLCTEAQHFSVQCPDPLPPPIAPDWQTFQGNAAHTGYVPVTLNPARFMELWRGALPGGVSKAAGEFRIRPVVTAPGAVFVASTTNFD